MIRNILTAFQARSAINLIKGTNESIQNVTTIAGIAMFIGVVFFLL
jgi:hypothetical protein